MEQATSSFAPAAFRGALCPVCGSRVLLTYKDLTSIQWTGKWPWQYVRTSPRLRCANCGASLTVRRAWFKRLRIVFILASVPFFAMNLWIIIDSWRAYDHHEFIFVLAMMVYAVGGIFAFLPQITARVFSPKLEIWEAPPPVNILGLD